MKYFAAVQSVVSSQQLRLRKQTERSKLLKEASQLFGQGGDTSGKEGLVYSYTFSPSNPGEAKIYSGADEVLIVLPNPIGKKEIFVQVTKGGETSEIIGTHVEISETEVTISLGSPPFSGEYIAVIFG